MAVLPCLDCHHRDRSLPETARSCVRSGQRQHLNECCHSTSVRCPLSLLFLFSWLFFVFLDFCSSSPSEPSSNVTRGGSLGQASFGTSSVSPPQRSGSDVTLSSVHPSPVLDVMHRIGAEVAHRGLSRRFGPGTILSTLQTSPQGSGKSQTSLGELGGPLPGIPALHGTSFLSPLFLFARTGTGFPQQALEREPRRPIQAESVPLSRARISVCSILCTQAAEGEPRPGDCPEAQECEQKKVAEWVKTRIQRETVVVFTKSYCPYCQEALEILYSAGVKHVGVIEIDKLENTEQIQDALEKLTGARTVPRVFFNGSFFGGCSDLEAAEENGTLKDILKSAGAL
ncbi:glutaredoxin [Cystoisospora suis]|uniref:Glutaredoxin n=1 Tax=Cystoisospora suis TaxID=483139 RepID=A0A2C6KMC2_9APIC|nr:glutaredoxin [Cystoisospora suis]